MLLEISVPPGGGTRAITEMIQTSISEDTDSKSDRVPA